MHTWFKKKKQLHYYLECIMRFHACNLADSTHRCCRLHCHQQHPIEWKSYMQVKKQTLGQI